MSNDDDVEEYKKLYNTILTSYHDQSILYDFIAQNKILSRLNESIVRFYLLLYTSYKEVFLR